MRTTALENVHRVFPFGAAKWGIPLVEIPNCRNGYSRQKYPEVHHGELNF
jgi:hypothetical protein